MGQANSGSWNNYPRRCRSGNRNNYNSDEADNNNIGFRLVSFPPPALFCARTGRWEYVGRAKGESISVPVMLVTASENQIELGGLVSNAELLLDSISI